MVRVFVSGDAIRTTLVAVTLTALVALNLHLQRDRWRNGAPQPPECSDGAAAEPPTRLTICTQVLDELPYLLEWITYYQIQGAHRVAICDLMSTDKSEFINELYEQRGIGGVVFEQTLALGNGSDGQLACFNQCFDRYKNDTDWFAAIDVDEFMWAPSHRRLVDFLAAQPDDVAEIVGLEMRFGSYGATKQFPNTIWRNESDGRLRYGDEAGAVHLITQERLHRGLREELGEPESMVKRRLFPNCTYSTASTSWIICNNNWGKSIGRTRDIESMNHHINNLREGARRVTPSSALRMHHHTIRSLEDALIKERQWKKCDPVDIWYGADTYFSSISDVSMLQYGAEMAQRIGLLQS